MEDKTRIKNIEEARRKILRTLHELTVSVGEDRSTYFDPSLVASKIHWNSSYGEIDERDVEMLLPDFVLRGLVDRVVLVRAVETGSDRIHEKYKTERTSGFRTTELTAQYLLGDQTIY